MIYTFRWAVNRSRGLNDTDKAVVGVIDGKRALLTGFRVGIVPPPMAHETLETYDSINAIIFAPSHMRENSCLDSNAFMLHVNHNTLVLYIHEKVIMNNFNLCFYKFFFQFLAIKFIYLFRVMIF